MLAKIALFILSLALSAQACTSFLNENGPDKLFAKSLDWYRGNGYVVVNKRGVSKTGMKISAGDSGTSPTWVSEYGSYTFNQYGREFPLGGMNENGLAIEILWLDSTQSETQDSRPVLNELQWIQYQLDNRAGVTELLQDLTEVRIHPELAKVHYLACDVTGMCATIEFLNGKPEVHTNERMPYKTITNNTYEESINYMPQFVGFGGTTPINTTSIESLDRFARAVSNNQNAKTEDDVFGVLKSVEQPGFTVWNVVYNLSQKKLSFHTAALPNVRSIDTKSFDLSCKSPVKILNMENDLSGDVSSKFVDYDTQTNTAMINASIVMPLTQEMHDGLASYPATTSCVQ